MIIIIMIIIIIINNNNINNNNNNNINHDNNNTWKYNIFCIFGKDGIYFSCKYDNTLLSKKQRSFSHGKCTK